MTELCEVCCCYLNLNTVYELGAILIATYSDDSHVSIKPMERGIKATVWPVALHLFRSLHTMYSLTLATII